MEPRKTEIPLAVRTFILTNRHVPVHKLSKYVKVMLGVYVTTEEITQILQKEGN